jgi:ABC-type glycerol-3-phosphate transport system substrate-binding protein
LESSKFEGKQYTIPGNVGSVALGWFWEPLEAAGVEPPQTWDEVRAAAEAIQAATPDWTPFDAACSPLCDHISMIWGATDSPLTSDGLVDWTGEASIAALQWKMDMVAAGLMPAVHQESFGNWLKGGTAIMTSYDVHGTMAQQTFGMDKATTGLNIRREADDPAAGAPFWLNGSVVLQSAANPQGMLDFYLWWFGPNNKATGQQIATVAAKPAYQYTFDEFIAPDEAQQWQLAGIELVRDSVPFPANLFWQIQNTVAAPWIEKALDASNNLTAEQAMVSALEEMEAEIAKMRS